jgi:hypothetical protein
VLQIFIFFAWIVPDMRDLLQRLKPYMGLLKWVIALVILGYLFYQNVYLNLDSLNEIADRKFRWADCCIAAALIASSVLLTFVRWYLLVWAQEFEFRLRDAFRLGFLGLLLNYVAPGQVGGDFFKAASIAREQQSRRLVAVATVVIDRILGLLALFIVGAIASLALPGLRENNVLASIAGFLWTGAIVGTVGLIIMLHPATPRSRWLNRLVHLKFVGRAIGDLIQAIVLYQSKRRVVVLAVAMSLFGHMGILSSFYFASRALQLQEVAPDYTTHLLIVPAAEVGASFVPLPGGVGVLEGAISYFYGEAESRTDHKELAKAGGLLATLLFRLITLLVAAVGFVCFMVTGKNRLAADETKTPESKNEPT